MRAETARVQAELDTAKEELESVSTDFAREQLEREAREGELRSEKRKLEESERNLGYWKGMLGGLLAKVGLSDVDSVVKGLARKSELE